MLEKITEWFNSLGATALGRLLPFVLILLGGMIVIRIVSAIVRKALSKSKLEKAAHGLIKSLARVVLYLLLGLVGLPVFSGFRFGAAALLDATGGFLWGFALGGFAYRLTEKLGKLPAFVLCQLTCYICGCLWFSRWANCGVGAAVPAE